MPKAVLKAFETFDPFFSELRYRAEAKQVDGLGEDS
jgi:hypothetical protein